MAAWRLLESRDFRDPAVGVDLVGHDLVDLDLVDLDLVDLVVQLVNGW